MKLHPRTLPVQRAGNELDRLVCDWAERHAVTETEAVRCLLAAAEKFTKMQLREERHPGEPDRKADEE